MINSSEFNRLYNFAIDKLKSDLAPSLTYHNVEHSLDVFRYVEIIGNDEEISENELLLLKSAALLHDMGFIDHYEGHEARSCEFARELLPGFGYSEKEIEVICGQIMATKIPQSPKNKLEKILCDADLDYLGRGDYYPIAAQLFREMKSRKRVEDESTWLSIQISFLESHNYWTRFGKEEREPNKQLRLAELKSQQ